MNKSSVKSTQEIFKMLKDVLLKESILIEEMIRTGKRKKLNMLEVKAFGEKNANSMVTNKDAGVYVFMVHTAVEVDSISGGKFNDVKHGAKTNKNLKCDKFCLNDCFYLGKAESKMLKRISEHWDSKNKSTYSLRLNDSCRKHVKEHLMIYTFVVKECYKDFRKDIVGFIEKYLHEKLLPKVGTKRS